MIFSSEHEMIKKVLLASHGTQGSRAAEQAAMNMAEEGTSVHHLVVVPELWKGMKGDDWLQNGSTRDEYGEYIESILENEIRENVDKLRVEMRGNNIDYDVEVLVGKPDECLLKVAERDEYDIVVMGSPRPKHVSGLRSRLKPEPLAQSLNTSLLIVPFPN